MLVPERYAAKIIFGIRSVDGDEPEFLIFSSYDSALLIGVAVGIAGNAIFFNDISLSARFRKCASNKDVDKWETKLIAIKSFFLITFKSFS